MARFVWGLGAGMEPKIVLMMLLIAAIQLVAYFGARAKSEEQETAE